MEPKEGKGAAPVMPQSGEIITNLPSSVFGVSIHAIKLLGKGDDAYLALSCTHIDTQNPLTLTVSWNMADKFGLIDILQPGNYNTEANPPLYLKVEAIKVPDDGRRYGYVGKDDKGDPVVREYRAKGTYIFRNLKEPLNGQLIRDAESGAAAASFYAKGYAEEANILFKIRKGYAYVPGVSVENDELYTNLYMRIRGAK